MEVQAAVAKSKFQALTLTLRFDTGVELHTFLAALNSPAPEAMPLRAFTGILPTPDPVLHHSQALAIFKAVEKLLDVR